MSEVVYSNGKRTPRTCPIHQRPIHPGTLTKYLYVREQLALRHVDHFMPEPGCQLCRSGGPRVAGSNVEAVD